MKTKKIGEVTLEYEEENENIILKEAHGTTGTLIVPDDFRITEIGAKAFFSKKTLREVILPNSVNIISDWAFSRCPELKVIQIDGLCKPTISKNAFEGLEKLEKLELGFNNPKLSTVAATLAFRLSKPQLLADDDIGSKEWYGRYDLALKAFLHEDDIEGYSNLALCGEEDISYDGIGSVDGELLGESYAYVVGVNKNKCALAFIRLLNDDFLAAAMKEILENYIRAHSLGCGNEAAFLVIKEDFKDNFDYLKLYLEIVKPDSKGYDRMLGRLNEDAAEMRALLIKEAAKLRNENDFFGGLTL